jgi:para-nitrobenzyl esterase
VPMIIGTTDVEPPLYFPPKQDGYPYSYFGRDAGKALLVCGFIPAAATINIGMDMLMHEPARFAARMITKSGNPAWLYRFSYVLENVRLFKKEASHADDIPFLFQNLDKINPLLIVTEKDWQASRAFSTYLANFVKSPAGNPDPNAAGLAMWQKFDQASFRLMRFTLDDGPKFAEDPLEPRIQLVQDAAERVTGAR